MLNTNANTMGLKIGFTEKFYTLWNISTETMYQSVNGRHYASGTKTNYTYHQNLSFDKNKAIEKAQSLGCKDINVDDELRGRHTSFWTTMGESDSEYAEIKKQMFNSGKYAGSFIKDVEDINYLVWYYGTTSCPITFERIKELNDGSFVIEGDSVLTPKEQKTQEVIRQIENGEIMLEAVSNFQIGGVNEEGVEEMSLKVVIVEADESQESFMEAFPFGYKIYVNVEGLDLVERSYKGFEYFVPNGMRSFKRTQFTLEGGKIKEA